MATERAFLGIWIPAELWLSKGFSLQEKVFYAEIESLDKADGCYATNEYFAEFFGLSAKRVSVVINDLVKKGVIDSFVDKSRGNKRILRIRHRYTRNVPDPIPTNGDTLSLESSTYILSDNITDNKTDTTSVGQKPDPIPYKAIVDHLNQKCSTAFRSTTKATRGMIKARFAEGFTFDDFVSVIDWKASQWISSDKFSAFLRPETLFCAKHFESYLNEVPKHERHRREAFGSAGNDVPHNDQEETGSNERGAYADVARSVRDAFGRSS